jgi:hypothetical protein
MGLSHSPSVPTQSLMLYLDAANRRSYPGSGTTWFDLSGNGYNGTLVNSPTFSSSGFFTFNGTNSTASVAKPFPNIVGQISVEVWVNFASYSNEPVLMHKGTHYTLHMRNSAGTDRWTWADSSNYSYANFGYRQASGLYATNTWMQLVCTKDTSNNVRLYKNGVLVDTRTTFGSALAATNSTLWIVGYSDNDTTPSSGVLNGSVAVAKVYNGTLSDTDVLRAFSALRGRFGL